MKKTKLDQILEKYELTIEEKLVMLAYFYDYLKERVLKKIEKELGEDDWLELGQFLEQNPSQDLGQFLDEIEKRNGSDKNLAELVEKERRALFAKFQDLLEKDKEFQGAVKKKDWERVMEFLKEPRP